MLKFLTVFAVLTCLCLNSKAQIDESRNFVYLYSDSVIYAKNIRLRHNFFNSLQLRADSKPIPLQKIKFFNNDEGFFANIKGLDAFGQIRLSERIIAGKINLYQERPYTTFLNRRHQDHNEVDVRMFYNKAYGNLKRVNYANLAVDMADNAESMDLLRNYRKNMNTSKALYIGAGASVVAALVTFLVGTKEEFNHQMEGPFPDRMEKIKRKNGSLGFSIGLLGIGTGLAIGGYSTNVSGLRKLESAVDTYNQ